MKKKMHYEILVEDASGKFLLEGIFPKIIEDGDTFRIHSYKGIGHLPKNRTRAKDIRHVALLNNLPRLLRGYENTYKYKEEDDYDVTIVVVCDLDERNKDGFRESLNELRDNQSDLKVVFGIAVEEGEAWLLGDTNAIRAAYPRASAAILQGYVNDSICGTWEVLADAIYSGGRRKLCEQGWQKIGETKCQWAKEIAPHMDVNANRSPSFCEFVSDIREREGRS